ncbi:MAG: insulinase family protein [Alphaproteobacteria bacterium]|nr:insulinase family protein [Alphaproteobacteria bacterium]
MIAPGRAIDRRQGSAPVVERLSNGVRIVIDRMPWLESIACGVWVNVGARDEVTGEEGIAHLIEHMAFKGAGERDARSIVNAIEDVGGWINAETTHERTSFFIRGMSKDLGLALELLRDIVLRPRFDAGDLSVERNVVAQEISEAGDDPEDLAFDNLQEALFDGSTLSKPILGSMNAIKQQTVAGLRAFHADGYGPSQIVVSVAGGVEVDDALSLASSAFSDASSDGRSRIREPATFKPGRRFVERDFDQAHLAIGIVGAAAGSPDAFAVKALTEILGGGMSSRLFQELREERGLAYTVDAAMETYEDVGTVTIYAGVDVNDAREAVSRTIGVIESLARKVTDVELNRAKAVLTAGAVMAFEQPQSRVEFAANRLIRNEEMVSLDHILSEIESIDVLQVRRAAELAAAGGVAFAGVGRIGARGILAALEKAIH